MFTIVYNQNLIWTITLS